MRDQQPSPANTPIAGPSADYVLAQLESAGAALEFSSELLDFDRFHTDDLRNRLLAQYDGGAEYTRLRAFCKSSATNLLDLIESFGPHATVCNLLTLALARRYSPDALAELSREALDHWIRTLSIACAARRIAALRGSSTESIHRVYAAGLLHEVGVFVLMESFPRAVRRALDRSRVAQKPINVCEVEILGTDHLVIGRRTLLRAAMPEWLIDAAWLHERAIENIPAPHDVDLLAHIQLAHAYVRQHGRAGTLPAESSTSLARLGVEASAVIAALDGLDREVADLVERLRLDPTRVPSDVPKLRRSHAELEDKLADAEDFARCSEQVADRLVECVHFFSECREKTVAEALRASLDFLSQDFDQLPIAILLEDVDAGLVRYAWRRDEVFVRAAAPIAESAKRLALHLKSTIDEQLLPDEVLDATPELREIFESPPRWFPLGSPPRIGMFLWSGESARPRVMPFMQTLCVAEVLRRALEREAYNRAIERFATSTLRAAPRASDESRIPEIIADLAGGAAHELNNPLSVISGRAQMLRAEITRPDLQHALDQIEAKAGECNQIMRDLLEFAHPPASNPARVGARELIDDTLATWARQARLAAAWIQNLGCRDAAAPYMHLFVDREQVRAALLELLRNADAAIRDNEGLISIAWQRDTQDTRYVVIELCDTGRGMTPEVARRAFDPFFSHRPAGRGRGLGLSRALRIVTAAGGTLTLESSPESGTVARVRLPLAESGA